MTGTHSVALWLIAALGLGLVIYGGARWAAYEPLGEDGIQLATELVYQAQLAQVRAQEGEDFQPSAEWERRRRAALRPMVEAAAAKQVEYGSSWLLVGVAVLIFSIGRMFRAPLRRR